MHGLAKVKYPPGPSGQPFLGSLLQARRDPLQFTLDLCRDYGDIVRFRIGMYYGYLINHPEYYRHVLITNQKNYDKQNYNYRKLRPVLGEGLITADGAQWRRIRCVIQPAFHAHRIRQLESQITRATEEMLDGWDERTTRGRPVAADEEMMKLAFRLISEALFSADLQDATEVVRKAFGVLNRDISWRFKHVWAPPLWMPVPRNIVFRRARKALDRVVYDIIRQRRLDGSTRDDMLNMLLQATDEQGRALPNTQIRDEVMTLMLAGHETTANLLTWTLGLLASNPNMQDMVAHTKTETVFDACQRATADTLYIKAVLQESLRLYPPVWIFSRRAIDNDVIGGYSVPAGTTVTMCTYALHRHPAFWDVPDRFDPERFARTSDGLMPHPAHFPFGAGPRTCIGGHLAMTEAQMVLSMICRRFRLKLASGYRLEPEPLVTLRPRGGLKLILETRSS